MKLVIVHHHFRPGGVRRVIEIATPHVVAGWPERVRGVILATGEAPDPDWLRCFRQRLKPTPVEVIVQPLLRYLSELKPRGEDLRHRLMEGLWEVLREVRNGQGLVWAHNLGLGRNLYLTRELTYTCRCAGILLIAHHHDWWFENRWHHFATMREPGFRKLDAVASAVLAVSPWICHVAVNQADATILEKHFPGLAGWLPNPLEPEPRPRADRVEVTRAWLRGQLTEEAPVWLLPCRLLRRKNVAEALLLTRWLRPEAWLVTTGGVSSAEEQAYADAMATAAQKHGWRLRLGVLGGSERDKPSVRELLAASEVVLLTSLQEGFGLPFLEAAAANRPLIARKLPNVMPDLAKFGFTFPQAYREILIDPSLFDWQAEYARQAAGFAAWKSLMPRAATRFVGKPAVLAAGKTPGPVPFSRLTLIAQLEVLSQPIERSWEKCVGLNPFLPAWQKRAVTQDLRISPWPRSAARWLSGPAYARRFLACIPPALVRAPDHTASQEAQTEFLRRKLSSENLYPILWHSQP